jgi:hypothetical protein
MDIEKELRSLHVEQSAHHIALTQILGALARDRSLRAAISEGFEQALGVAQSLSESPPEATSPEHGIKILRVIEDIRSTVMGNEKPKGRV